MACILSNKRGAQTQNATGPQPKCIKVDETPIGCSSREIDKWKSDIERQTNLADLVTFEEQLQRPATLSSHRRTALEVAAIRRFTMFRACDIKEFLVTFRIEKTRLGDWAIKCSDIKTLRIHDMRIFIDQDKISLWSHRHWQRGFENLCTLIYWASICRVLPNWPDELIPATEFARVRGCDFCALPTTPGNRDDCYHPRFRYCLREHVHQLDGTAKDDSKKRRKWGVECDLDKDYVFRSYIDSDSDMSYSDA